MTPTNPTRRSRLQATLNQPAYRQEILDRLAQVTPQDAGLWGVMSVHQMICHLEDSYNVALGRRAAGPVNYGSLARSMVKWFALKSPAQWPKGVKTLPEVEQGKGGSPPKDFVLERDTLCSTVRTFCDDLPSPPVPHSIFGKMTAAEWMRWGYLHADHHLRQFGR